MDKITYLRIAEIVPNSMNLRSDADKNNLHELAESIKAVGLINPITVRVYDDNLAQYQIVSGERRFKAAKLAGLEEIPAIIRDLDDNQTMEIIITENLQRKDPNPLDEASGFNWLLNTGRYDVEAIADKVGKPVSYVSKRLKFVQLSDEVRDKFRAGEITIGHALEFARLNEKQQEKMLKWMEANKYSNPTATRLKEAIQQQFHLKLKDAVFDTEDDLLLEDLPGKNKYCGVLSCKMCVKRTGFNTNLFDDLSGEDNCTDPDCYETKLKAHIEKTIHTYVEKDKPIVQYSHTETPEKPGTLTKKSDLVIVKRGDKKCEATTDAIVSKVGPYHYDFDKQVGEIIKVCTDPNCKVHKRSKSSSNEAANDKQTAENQKKYEKAKFDARVRELTEIRSITKLMPKIKVPLDSDIVEKIASGLIEEFMDYQDDLETLLREKGWTEEQISDFELHKYFEKLSNNERLKFIAELVLRGDYTFAEKYLKKHKIDIAKLKKEARAELKLQEKAVDTEKDLTIPENEEEED